VASPQEVLEVNRRNAIASAEEGGVGRTRKLLQAAERDLTERLRSAVAGPGDRSFTVAQLRSTLAQVRQTLADLAPGLAETILDVGGNAADEAARGTSEYLEALDKKFRGVGSQPLALKEASMLDAAREGARGSILHRLAGEPGEPGRGVLARYGASVVAHFETQLRVGLVSRRPWADVRASLIEKSPFLQQAPAHWAERIVRTEIMGAHNRAHWETIREADEQLGDMVKILCATFDERTGSDSFAVHGQIRKPEQAFESWFGLYQHPPNRPNDREVVVPHRTSWPLPRALAWRSPSEIAQRWRAEGRKKSVPERPNMTTVPLKSFGKG
jgi:hypothetical protein